MTDRQLTEHPNAQRLDALAAGDVDEAAAEHVAECAACSDYLERLRAEAAAFAGSDQARAFAGEVERRASLRPQPSPPKRRWPRVVVALAPLVAAAAVAVLLLRTPGTRLPAPVASDRSEQAIRFKGALPLAVIRERDGRQERFTNSVTVRARDGLRLELAVDRSQMVSAGLLSDDGSYLELVAPGELSAGTHLSEQAARFDAHPTPGLLIAGEPAAVERAKATRRPEGVAVLRVVLEP